MDINFLKGKSLIITGGTGSLGQGLTGYILNHCPKIGRLVIFSRDEQKQHRMAQVFAKKEFPQIEFVIGDVRDKARVTRVMEDMDFVIHTAAMKYVHIAEHNPDECIKTNIGGAQNLIEACLKNNVKSVVALSTDKACAPISLYGATKLTSDKLFIAANNIRGGKPIRFSVVRYGNVMGSSGSVVPFFMEKKITDGILPITHPDMTRFNISLNRGVEIIMHALENAWGGELFVPKLTSYKILDLAEAICPDCEKKIVGIRPGEKMHEEMILPSDSPLVYDHGAFYTILPKNRNWELTDYITTFKALKVEEGFSYSSENNDSWETIKSMKKLIKSSC